MKSNPQQTFHSLSADRGFSLLEIMSVVAILGLLVVMAIPMIGGVNDRKAAERALSNARLMQSALDLYEDEVFDHSAYSSASPEDRYLIIIDDSRWTHAPSSLSELNARVSPYELSPPSDADGSVVITNGSSVTLNSVSHLRDLPGY